MAVTVKYDKTELKKLCEQRNYARKVLGQAGAKKLGRRFKELETAPDSVTLRQGPGGWHPIKHDWPGCLGGELHAGSTIIAEPCTSKDGDFYWLIICIGDCYKH